MGGGAMRYAQLYPGDVAQLVLVVPLAYCSARRFLLSTAPTASGCRSRPLAQLPHRLACRNLRDLGSA